MTETAEQSLQRFLIPTKCIESQHPTIIAKAKELTDENVTVEEKARSIFYFIRDKIRYEFRAKFHERAYLASQILHEGKGFCTQKAILFCALARSCGIPAGIYFYDIVDYLLPDSVVAFMNTRILYRHGITALYLNGAWYKYDATLDSTLTRKNSFPPVEFSPDRDCLISKRTSSGRKFIEYIHEHGLYADVSFEQILTWFKQGYPRLVDKYLK